MHAPVHFTPVPLDKGLPAAQPRPTVLVSAAHKPAQCDGRRLGLRWTSSPPKVTVVLDKATRTRELVEASGHFALQLPTVPQAALTEALGH